MVSAAAARGCPLLAPRCHRVKLGFLLRAVKTMPGRVSKVLGLWRQPWVGSGSVTYLS